MALAKAAKARLAALDPSIWRMLRWSLMAAALFWVIVYRLGASGSALPGFVYVNF